MSGLEVNKIIASIILAIIIIVLIGYIGNILIDTKNKNLKETAYKIDIPEKESAVVNSSLSQENTESIASLLSNASLEKGEKKFKKCGTCHSVEKDGSKKVGPNLWNIINRPKADISGYAYSKALAEYGGVWTYEELSAFIYKPKEYIPGTKMNFAGLKNIEDRANLIAWMREQSDNPVPLP